MPRTPEGYEAWVEMGGQRLQEFKCDGAVENRKTTCYIPCEAGKEFSVCCNIPAHKVMGLNHSVYIELDGKKITLMGNVVRRRIEYNTVKLEFKADYTNNYMTLRNFQFGSLDLTDDEALLGAPSAQNFGQIVVKVNTVVEYITKPVTESVARTSNDDYRIHERSKKGIAHCVRFGQEQASNTRVGSTLTAVGSQLAHTFVFNYRHMDLLVTDGIAPRVTLAAVTPNAAASASGARRASGKRKADEVKEEPSQAGSKRVKKESKPVILPGEVIDLTEDEPPRRVKKEWKPIMPGEVIDLT